MPFLITIILAAIVLLIVLSFAAHFLFSPWILLIAVAALVWFKFRPGRSRR
ncbi:MAG TPA: hypothetical protein VK817_18310 [Trebonia sp.]|jgi:hypothetical protein|nr:hypothetical protein [Trebonia sp.]